jgi:hypothetical protein
VRDLGNKEEMFVADQFAELDLGRLRPDAMPELPDGHSLICGYEQQGLGERMIVCDTLEDAQTLFDAWARGGALRIKWYVGAEAEPAHAPGPGRP